MSRLLFSAVFPVAFVSVFSLFVNAKETTWIGGSCGYISDSANWDNGVPAGGDKVIFNKSVSLSNNTESATFEMGEGGLEFCIAPNCTLTDRVSYSGVGDLKLTGGGTWDFYGGIKIGGNSYSVGDFTGNVEVVNGIFCPGVNTWYRYCLGGNRNDVKIKVHLDTGGRLNLTKYQTVLCNDVILTGGDDVEHAGMSFSQSSYIRGDLYSDSDMRISSGWAVESNKRNGLFVELSNSYQVYNRGRVFASGRTLFVDCSSKGNWFLLPAEVNGSIVKSGAGNLELSGVSTNVANCLELCSATNVLTSTARWYGTNVVVKNSGTLLELNDARNLSIAACLSIGEGAKIHLHSNSFVAVKECMIDGAPLPAGEYDSMNLPGALEGNGMLQVVGACKTWVGGDKGSISDPANWDDNKAPKPGDSLMFRSSVELEEEEFDLGENDLTVIADRGCTLKCYVVFKGEGGIVEKGAGKFDYRKAGAFSGDVHIRGGVFYPGMLTWGPFYVGGEKVTINVYRKFGATLDLGKYCTCFYNNINLIGCGDLTTRAIFVNDQSFVAGTVTADGDFYVGSGGTEHSHSFRGGIHAPGHTMRVAPYFTNKSETSNTNALEFRAEVDASILRDDGIGILKIMGSSPNPDNSFAMTQGTNMLTETAYWGGTNIIVSGSETVLRLFAKTNLSENASISLNDGGLIDVAGNFLVRVAAMSIDGVALGNGIYRTSNCASVRGPGAVKVGAIGMVLTVR
jgi:hypothetical protein